MTKKKRYEFIILFGSLFFLVFCVYLYGEHPIFDGGGIVRPWKEEEGQLYAYVSRGWFGSEPVSIWKNEKDEKYYLFLPCFWAEKDSLKIKTPSHEEVCIDDEILSIWGKVSGLTCGLHRLSIDGREYELEVMRGSEIPALFVDMPEKNRAVLMEEPYTEQYGGSIRLINESGKVELSGSMDNIRVRGNTSADWVKKPCQITMRQAIDFFGMGSARKWNLLSNWSDKTLIRNKIAYDMASAAHMPYSPESCFVDMYLNGEYQGCYQLCEKVEIGKNRVDIRNMENDVLGDEDITGGYLLEIERPSRIEHCPQYFITALGQPVSVKRPRYAGEEKMQYIAALWQTFEDAYLAEDGINPGSGKHYTEYIDTESFVKKYLVEEIVRNYDASSTSQYFYKDTSVVDDKIYAGPVWDYDMSMGNPIMTPLTNQHYISSVSPYGLFAALPMDEFSLWYHLYEREEFKDMVADIYGAEFLPVLKRLENGGIESYAGRVRESACMDGVRWGRNRGETEEERIENYNAEVEHLKDFISAREYYLTGLWMDGRESKKVYLDGGEADMYISYVEGLVGDVLEEPLAPEMEGCTFVRWLNGYTKEPYDFTKPYDGSDLYFVAEYKRESDGKILIAGEQE